MLMHMSMPIMPLRASFCVRMLVCMLAAAVALPPLVVARLRVLRVLEHARSYYTCCFSGCTVVIGVVSVRMRMLAIVALAPALA